MQSALRDGSTSSRLVPILIAHVGSCLETERDFSPCVGDDYHAQILTPNRKQNSLLGIGYCRQQIDITAGLNH